MDAHKFRGLISTLYEAVASENQIFTAPQPHTKCLPTYLKGGLFFILALAVAFPRSTQAAESTADQKTFAESGMEMDRIDILGVKAFTNQMIESTLEVSPGDHLERLKVVRTEENLQALYLSHGYEEVGIRSRLVRKRDQSKKLETVLEFDIHEGRPARIAAVDLVRRV